MGGSGRASAGKWVYAFGGGLAEGGEALRDLLGDKGAGLAEMSRLGLPVPPGFTLTTAVGAHRRARGGDPEGLGEQFAEALVRLEGLAGARFGDPARPLLLSVRSGAALSMPGMMDTVLNVGLNDRTAEGLARASGDGRFARDCHRRFVQSFGTVVLGVPHHHFEDLMETARRRWGARADAEMPAEAWRDVVVRSKAVIERVAGRPLPEDAGEQLRSAVDAVLASWTNPRAGSYRRLHGIPEEGGTAVTVQAMVFGNLGPDGASGVACTRDAATGERRLYGEYLPGAQGEDVVAGIRTPLPLTVADASVHGAGPAMEVAMPDVFAQLAEVARSLERHRRDMQEIEFTVERGRLFLLQARAAKRTARAALKLAVDLAQEGAIDRREAVRRVDPADLAQVLHPTVAPGGRRDVVARGLPASPGLATGRLAFAADVAEAMTRRGDAVVLCREETSPEDIRGFYAARGVLTIRGGMTSHAAVIARSLGRPCVTGAGVLRIDHACQTLEVRGRSIPAGEVVTVDGSTGEVMLGEVAAARRAPDQDFATLMGWGDGMRRLGVRACADTPREAALARENGADGIGLCRTERMFLDPERILQVREAILAPHGERRSLALERLGAMQRRDFASLFAAMPGMPVTIRLLDLALHEFLPDTEAAAAEVARSLGLETPWVRQRAAALGEANPALGHRGCRLGVTFPGLYEMQARAAMEAAASVRAESGEPVRVDLCVPLVVSRREVDFVKGLADRAAARVREADGVEVERRVGAMVELPRACLLAGEIARSADFFVFGTDDLTQATLGIGRDDRGSFMPEYRDAGIYPVDPFATLDEGGVGELLALAAERGRRARPGLEVGVAGGLAGDPASIDAFERLGLDFVSCPPEGVPVARLAAAQAADARKP